MKEYVEMWKRAFDFSGRTTVRGYWMAILINFVVSIAVSIVCGIIRLPFLYTIYGFVLVVPMLAMALRRMRDAGKQWFWIIVPIVNIVFLISPSVDGE